MTEKWIKRFLQEAKQKSTWSKDPSTKIGSIAVGKHKQIIASGYNGFPRGIKDTPERYADKKLKYSLVAHSEMNLIFNACLTGVSLEDSSLFVYGLPVCNECAKGIIQTGIKEVYMLFPKNVSDKWEESFKLTKEMFDEAGIKYKVYYEEPYFY